MTSVQYVFPCSDVIFCSEGVLKMFSWLMVGRHLIKTLHTSGAFYMEGSAGPFQPVSLYSALSIYIEMIS